MREDGLHLAPYHLLDPVARLSKGGTDTSKFKSTDIEPVADKVQRPLVCGRIWVAEVKYLLVIGGVFCNTNNRFGQGIHSNDIHGAGRIGRDVDSQVKAIRIVCIVHEPIQKIRRLKQDIPTAERCTPSSL